MSHWWQRRQPNTGATLASQSQCRHPFGKVLPDLGRRVSVGALAIWMSIAPALAEQGVAQPIPQAAAPPPVVDTPPDLRSESPALPSPGSIETPVPEEAAEAGSESASGNDAPADNVADVPAQGDTSAAVAAAAQEPPTAAFPYKAAPIEPESYSNGSFDHQIPIIVPGFRGLEPKLSLTYQSSATINARAATWLGRGWSLDGVPIIERVSEGRGAPAYDDSDVYQLAGEEMIACSKVAANVSASCTAGGNWSTRIESYRKIIQNKTQNIWSVLAKDGTVYKFESAGSFQPTPVDCAAANADPELCSYRWLLASVTDTHGNAVSYSWSCADQLACRITRIVYNRTFIYFLYEARPDLLLYGTGKSVITVRHRLVTVDVRTRGMSGDPVRVRAYAIRYDQSPVGGSSDKGMSRVLSVQQYGTDAILDDSIVTGGTALPATRSEYYDFSRSIESGGSIAGPGADIEGSTLVSGDFNGDGKDDLLRINLDEVSTPDDGGDDQGEKTIGFDVKIGFKSESSVTPKVNFFIENDDDGVAVHSVYAGSGDFNGDGADDIYFIVRLTTPCIEPYSCSDTYYSYLLQSIVTRSSPAGAINAVRLLGSIRESFTGGDDDRQPRFQIADLTGDGLADLVLRSASSVYLGTTDGLSATSRSWAPVTLQNDNATVADFTGDGLADLVTFTGTSEADSRVALYVSTGRDFSAVGSKPLDCRTGDLQTCVFNLPKKQSPPAADVNGDGLADVIIQSGSGQIIVALSTGRGFQIQRWYSNPERRCSAPRIGDFNGDGRQDILCFSRDLNVYFFVLSTGYHFADLDWLTSKKINGTLDYNGDGATDYTAPDENGINIYVLETSTSDLLQKLTYQSGGSIQIDYAPSTKWPVYKPLPFITQTVARLSVRDGTLDDNGNLARSITELAFKDPRWSWSERSFLGFRRLDATLPLNTLEKSPPTVEVEFSQAFGSIGATVNVKQNDADGVLRLERIETYSSTTSLPYRSENTRSQRRNWEGDTSSILEIRTDRAFDVYGNVTTQVDYGVERPNSSSPVDSDNRRTSTSYVQNLNRFIVDTPRVRGVFAPDGDLLAQDSYYYDCPASASDSACAQRAEVAPDTGDQTMLRRWVNTSSDGTANFVFSRTEYDAFGNVTAERNPLGYRTVTAYDPLFNLFVVRETPPVAVLERTWEWEWDPTGNPAVLCDQPTASIDPNGQRTRYGFDELCRLTSILEPLDRFTRVNYFEMGTPLRQRVYMRTPGPVPDTASTDPDWREEYFDGLGRPVKTRQRGPSASKTILVDRTYLARGDLGSETAPYYDGDPAYSTLIARDFANREILRTFPGTPSRTIAINYVRPADADPPEAFNRVIVTDENGHKSAESFGAFATVVRRLGFRSAGNTDSVSTLITWDRLGRLSRIDDPIGATWLYRWDGLGRRTRIDDPDAGTRTFAYDDASRLIAENNELREVTRYNYDAAGRVLKRTERADTPQAAVAAFAYDQVRSGAFNIGHRTTAIYGDVTERANFDALGRQVLEQYELPDAGVFNSRTAYDAVGRILYRTWPDGTSTGTVSDPWLYDEAGRLRFVRGLLSQASYDASDRPVLSRVLEVETTWTYDPNRGWPTTMTVRNQDSDTLFLSRVYNRDGTGRLTSVNAQGSLDDWVYTYDWLYRLIRADNAGDDTADRSWTYDDAGRIVTSNKLGTYTYATGTHRVTKTSTGNRSYGYDAIGALISGSPSGARTLTYDGGGRLVEAVQGGVTSRFVYDADGRRVRRTLSGGTSNDTLYLGDVEITPATASGTGAASRSVTVYPYPGARVVTTQTRAAGATTWVTGASTRLTMHRDTLKSVSAESFASGTNSNTLARRTFYAPYGEKLASATWNGAPPNSKGWIGERAEPDAGLIYLNARWYDPALSRFTRPDKLDPIIPGVGPDQYGYAGGDPVNNSDPGGEFVGAGVGGGLGAAAGLAGRAIGDLWEGKLSSFGDYAKATAEGALVGAAVGSGGAVLGAAVGGAIAVGGALVEGRVPTPGDVIAGAAGGALAGIGLPIGGKAVAAGATSTVAGAALKGEVAQVAKSGVPSVDILSRAAAVIDRRDLTAAGRALQKHGGRKGSVFPAVKGNPSSINEQGQRVVDDILNNPNSITITTNNKRFGEVIEVIAPDGRGVRYSIDGNFIGLLEP